MRRSSLPHQVNAFRKFRNEKSAGFLMEMRLGKTQPCARWMASRPGARRYLIVAPISAQRGWEQQIKADDLGPVHVLTGIPKKDHPDVLGSLWSQGGWFITNYQGLTLPGHKTGGRNPKPKAVPAPIAQGEWDVVALDESTAIKAPTSQQTKVCLKWLQPEYRAILTGLPDPEGVQDYVCQMIWCFGEFMGKRDYWSWRVSHMMPGFAGGWMMRYKSVKPAHNWVKDHCFVMTRAEVGDLPPIRQRLDVELPSKVERALRRLEASFELPEAGLITMNKLNVVTWSLGITGGRFKHLEDLHHNAKINEVLRQARGELKREPLIVYAARTAEVLALVEALDKHGGAEVVYGDLDKQQRDLAVERYMNGKVRHLVANPAAMRMGVDASRGDTIIYMSNTPSAETRAQSGDRPKHLRKMGKVRIAEYDIVCPGEADDDVAECLSEKRLNTIMTKQALVRRLMQRKESRARG